MVGADDDLDEGPQALVSQDEELRRMALPVLAAPAGTSFVPAPIAGPIEWGLERYDDDEEDALALQSPALVSSTWRFWTIMLAVFSAVLLGIIAVGYFFLRDIRDDTQQLSAENQAAAIILTFTSNDPDPDSNLRADGYFDRQRGRALLTVEGLPPIIGEQRYVVWAENSAGISRVADRLPVPGSSSQYMELPRVPRDASRIFLTIETRVDGETPDQPLGEVLLEASIE
jgi:hypothetical protein